MHQKHFLVTLLLYLSLAGAVSAQTPNTLAEAIINAYSTDNLTQLCSHYNTSVQDLGPRQKQWLQTGLKVVSAAVANSSKENVVRYELIELPGEPAKRRMNLIWNFEPLVATNEFKSAFQDYLVKHPNTTQEEFLNKCIVESAIRTLNRKVKLVITGTGKIAKTIIVIVSSEDENDDNEDTDRETNNDTNRDEENKSDGLVQFSSSSDKLSLLIFSEGNTWCVDAAVIDQH